MNKQRLLLDQLERKMKSFLPLQHVAKPPIGWIKTTRNALGMSLEQMGRKLGMTRQGVMKMEEREIEGSLTLKNLKEAANVLDMHLIYGFVPKEGSLEALIEKKARECAIEIVSRASNTMRLEDQENSEERIRKAIDQRAEELKQKLPKILWD